MKVWCTYHKQSVNFSASMGTDLWVWKSGYLFGSTAHYIHFPTFFMHHTTVRSVSLFAFYFPFYLLDFSSFYPKTEAKKSCPKPNLRRTKKSCWWENVGPWKKFFNFNRCFDFFSLCCFQIEWNVLCMSNGLCDGEVGKRTDWPVIFAGADSGCAKNVLNCFFFASFIEIFFMIRKIVFRDLTFNWKFHILSFTGMEN